MRVRAARAGVPGSLAIFLAQLRSGWLHFAPTFLRRAFAFFFRGHMTSSPSNPAPQRGDALTPMAFVHAILLAYEKYGVDPAGLLARAGIPRADLRRKGARITGRQMELVSEHAMRELDDEALGWYHRRLAWGTYGFLFRASLTSPNLEVALRRWFRHHGLLVDDIALGLEVTGDVATVRLAERVPLGPMRAFCLVSTLRYIHGFACWLIDSRVHLNSVFFPHRRPADAEVYDVVFSRPVEFATGAAGREGGAGFSFDASYLALPPVRSDADLRQLLRRPLPLPIRPYRRDRLTIARVRRLLQTDLARHASVAAVAAQLNLSPRTLHRQFEEEGASFQQLKDSVRRELALELVQRGDKPVKQIARLVGFANEKSFFRVFARWTGTTPGALRRRPGRD